MKDAMAVVALPQSNRHRYDLVSVMAPGAFVTLYADGEKVLTGDDADIYTWIKGGGSTWPGLPVSLTYSEKFVDGAWWDAKLLSVGRNEEEVMPNLLKDVPLVDNPSWGGD